MDIYMMTGLFIWVVASMGLYVGTLAGVDIPAAGFVTLGSLPVLLILPWRRIFGILRAVHGGCRYHVGQHVVYLLQKHGTNPGPRSEQVHAAVYGDHYRYMVRKLWTVSKVLDNGRIEVVTRKGKTHIVPADDPRLHSAGLLESLKFRLVWRRSFPELQRA